MNSTATFLCTAAALAALPCGPALADPPAQPTQSVSIADLDFNSPSAINTLYKRIERAAREVCQMPRDTRQLSVETGIKACKANATRRAVLQANLRELTALYLVRTGRPLDSGAYANAAEQVSDP